MTPSALNVTFDADTFSVELSDGRTFRVPLVWFPRLLHATEEQRAQYQLSSRGIHWDAIDEDISVDGLRAERGDAAKPLAIAAQRSSSRRNSQADFYLYQPAPILPFIQETS